MNLASYKAGNNVKTFLLIAALTALLLLIGFLIGGASGIIVFAVIAVVFNFVDVLVQREVRAEDEQGGRGQRGRGAGAAPHDRHARRARRRPEARRLRHARRAAQRLRDRAQPQARRHRGHRRHPAGARRPRELEGVLAHEMAHIKNRDILIASIAAMVAGAIAAIANFLQFSLFFGGDDNDNPLGIIGTIATIILAPHRGDDHPARRLAPARVRGRRDRRRADRRPEPAGRRPRDAAPRRRARSR